MEENKAIMVSAEQLEAATKHYQKVYEVSQRIEVRTHEINLFRQNIERLQAERDELFERLIKHRIANEMDQQWLESARLPLTEEEAAKVIPMILNNNCAPDSAA